MDGAANSYPCFQFSALDCFVEGAVSIPGLANNTLTTKLYGGRLSYNSTFDFATDFSATYLQNSCAQWYNLVVPYRLLFGGAEFTASGTLTSAGPGRCCSKRPSIHFEPLFVE